jgi:hypothetical protein
MGTPSRDARPSVASPSAPRRGAVGRVLGLLGLVEIAVTALALVAGWVNPDFVAFAVSVGLSLLFLGDFLRRGQAVLLTVLGVPVGFALGQGYVLWSQRGDIERVDALLAGAVGALVGLLLGYVAAGQHENRSRAGRE